MLSKRNSKGIHIVYFYLYTMSRKGKSIETEYKLTAAWGWEWELTKKGNKRFYTEVMKMF